MRAQNRSVLVAHGARARCGDSAPRRLLGAFLRGLVLFVAAAAPVAGDVGSCGQDPVDLDAAKFFANKQAIDCQRCTECGTGTTACDAACSPGLLQSEFPPGCYPLVHDGEVCLDALLAASCDEYATYLHDTRPTVPTECNFCPPEKR